MTITKSGCRTRLHVCRKTDGAGGGRPTERMLDWAAAAIGVGARIVMVRALHGGEGPWRLGIESRGHLTEAVLRAPTPRINAAVVAHRSRRT